MGLLLDDNDETEFERIKVIPVEKRTNEDNVRFFDLMNKMQTAAKAYTLSTADFYKKLSVSKLDLSRHLTDKAKLVFNKQVTSTVVETVVCSTCKKEVLRHDYAPCGHADAAIKTRLVQFMGTTVSVSLACEAVRENSLEIETEIASQELAGAFNQAVDRNVIGLGILASFYIDLPMTDLARKRVLLVYPVSILGAITPEEHNIASGLYKGRVRFTQESELP